MSKIMRPNKIRKTSYETTLKLTVTTKVIALPSDFLDKVNPSWCKNLMIDLNQWLLLLEQFKSLIELADSNLFKEYISWSNELLSIGEEIQTSFISDMSLISKVRDDSDYLISGLIDQLSSSPDGSDFSSSDLKLETALIALTDFWVNKIKQSGELLYYSLIGANPRFD